MQVWIFQGAQNQFPPKKLGSVNIIILFASSAVIEVFLLNFFKVNKQQLQS